MKRGPKARRALIDAIPIGQLRGKVQQAYGGVERLYDFTIVCAVPIAFVKVGFAPRILAAISLIAEDFREDIRELRLITKDAAISLELWLRSKHGTWRFFRVTGDGIMELGRDGRPLA